MGGTDSKAKIEEQFEIFKIQKDGSALLKSKADSKQYLMRVIICSSQADIDRLKALLECRAQLKNHHLLSLVQIKEKQQDLICSIHFKMYLVLQYSFKNIAQQIKERASSITENYFQQSDIWSIIYSCCNALNTLYSNGATHQSITAQQIFINKDGFVKMSQPLLFGLQKNHLDAMRTKDEDVINVHLSPQIMSCLDDQNFFYYDKEKSDIFILGMILVDVALLSFNYLYDPIKRKSLQNTIPSLLNKVSQRYSSNLVELLQQMLKIQSKQRPSFNQIIQRVQKYNNIGEEFTVESDSNIKSNDMIIQQSKRSNQQQQAMNHNKIQKIQKTPVKNIDTCPIQPIVVKKQLTSSRIHYVQMKPQHIKNFPRTQQQPFVQQKVYSNTQQLKFDHLRFPKQQQINHNNVKVITSSNQVISQSPQRIHHIIATNPYPPVINPNQHIHHNQQNQYNQQNHHNQHTNVISYRKTQISSNEIHQQPVIINNQQINFNHNADHKKVNSALISSRNQQFHQQSQRPSFPHHLTGHSHQKSISFNTHERSKSINTVKNTNQVHYREPNISKFTQTANKNYEIHEKRQFRQSFNNSLNFFSEIPKDNTQLFTSFNIKSQLEKNKSKRKEPIFTHQIPEVYNLLRSSSNTPFNAQSFKKEDFNNKNKTSYNNQIKSYAQEQYKTNKFTNLKNIPYDAISRVSQEQQSNATFQNIQLKKNISQTHSENINFPKKQMLTHQTSTQQIFKGNLAQSPIKLNFANNSNGLGQVNAVSSNYILKTPIKNIQFSEDELKRKTNIPSSNMIQHAFTSIEHRKHIKQSQSYSSNFYDHNKQLSNINLQFCKEVIPGKGRYQGYKYNGQKHGNGILYFEDGGHYEGEWKHDKMNGFGRLYYQNGKIAYQGHWQNDEFNGQGRVYNCDPVIFAGQFNYKDFSQLGNNWIYYEGQFKNDSKHGKGYIMLSNGQTFEGLFDNDMIEGNGIFYKSTGEIILGFWIDNKLFLNQSYEKDTK